MFPDINLDLALAKRKFVCVVFSWRFFTLRLALKNTQSRQAARKTEKNCLMRIRIKAAIFAAASFDTKKDIVSFLGYACDPFGQA